jgi:hypothetical protein
VLGGVATGEWWCLGGGGLTEGKGIDNWVMARGLPVHFSFAAEKVLGGWKWGERFSGVEMYCCGLHVWSSFRLLRGGFYPLYTIVFLPPLGSRRKRVVGRFTFVAGTRWV